MNRLKQARSTHGAGCMLTIKNVRYRNDVVRYLCGALKSDIGSGDITTQLCIRNNAIVEAYIITKQAAVIAGLQEARFLLIHSMPCRFWFKKRDGDKVSKGESIMVLKGRAAYLLKYERTLLNLIGRMSSIATNTCKIVENIKKNGLATLITPTRKTFWGLLDKRACILGGGGTHRLSLSDAVLIKHPHQRCCGQSLAALLQSAYPRCRGRFFGVEVSCYRDALTAARAYAKLNYQSRKVPFVLLLDNMTPMKIRHTITTLEHHGLRRNLLIEASGNIASDNVIAYARTGVDIISMGSITHNAGFIDMSLRIISP